MNNISKNSGQINSLLPTHEENSETNSSPIANLGSMTIAKTFHQGKTSKGFFSPCSNSNSAPSSSSYLSSLTSGHTSIATNLTGETSTSLISNSESNYSISDFESNNDFNSITDARPSETETPTKTPTVARETPRFKRNTPNSLKIADPDDPVSASNDSASAVSSSISDSDERLMGLIFRINDTKSISLPRSRIIFTLTWIAGGRFSHVYTAKENPDVVIKTPKILRNIAEKIQCAITQYEELLIGFNQNGAIEEKDLPFVKLLNTKDAAEVGYSIVEKVTPLSEADLLWSPTDSIGTFTQQQKDDYSAILDLLLYNDLMKTLKKPELDLKLNNLGRRSSGQLVLLDYANTDHKNTENFEEKNINIAFRFSQNNTTIAKALEDRLSIDGHPITQEDFKAKYPGMLSLK